jgi:DNA polymerase-3 subunit delta'
MLLLEPTGPDILVGKDAQDPNTARWFASRSYLSPPEPGRKIMVVLQADRLRVEAADVLLKALEEPPTDTIFVLMSARPDELPETVRSRVQEIGFPPLSEAFVVEALMGEGVAEELARLACRLSGGNLGRARRTAKSEHGLDSRTVALSVGAKAAAGPAQALGAAEELLVAAKGFRGVLGEELELEFEPFLDPKGKPEEAFKGIIRRMKEQHERRLRRAEREFLDSALLALAAHWRDVAVVASGGGPEMLINVDLADELQRGPAGAAQAGLAMGHVEEARADLADDTNLNARLVLERMFLKLCRLQSSPAG